MKAEVRTVKLLMLPTLTEGEMDDGVSALLSEAGIYGEDPLLLDWAYVEDGWQVIELPEPYEEGAFLAFVEGV